VVDSSSATLAKTQTSSGCTSCTASISVEGSALPLNVKIQVFKGSNRVATSGTLTIWGGDTYSFSS
jgi:hypothetical protein